MESRKYALDALFYFPLIEDGDADFVTDYTPAAGDAKIFTDKLISTNPTALILGFDSLSELPAQGAQLDENGAGTAEGVVAFTVIVSGTVGGGDAAGFFFMRSVTGQAWTNNDQIDINGGTANIATADSTTYDLAATAGLIAEIGNGMFAACLSPTEMTCAQGQIHIVDSATKAIEDQAIQFHTFGNAAALHAIDLDDSVRAGLTALPNAAADAAGGLPISDAGGLALDTQLAATNEVTAARMAALTDWINGGRLDLLLDAIPTTAMRGTDSALLASSDGSGLTEVGGDGDHLTALPISPADVIQISGDSTAADNLELMYDGTGYTDPTAPASRSQVDAIGAASGGSVNIAVSEDNTSAAIDPGSTTKVWATVVGTFANTEADNGLSHDFTDSANDISHVYGFQVGGGRIATAVDFLGNVDGNNDQMQIEVWDHVGADWEVIGTIAGSGATTNVALDLPLLSKHTGTSAAEIGKVYIQMDTNSTTPSDLSVKLLLVQAVNIGQTVGYEGGQIWINTGGTANTNTESFVDGVADNTVSTLAAAKIISANTGLNDFHVINGSSITLAESTDNESYFGDEWTLALGGQSCAKAHFDGATVSGIATGSGNSFHRGEIQTVTLGDEFHITEAGISGTITLPAGSGAIFNCHHDGASAPIMDFGDAVGSTTLHLHSYNGGVEMQNMGDSGTDIVHLDGSGKLIINANCVGGTINYRGNWEVVDSSGGAVTLNKDDKTVDIEAIKVPTDKMVFTKANELDGNTKSINDAEVVGDGNATPWDGA